MLIKHTLYKRFIHNDIFSYGYIYQKILQRKNPNFNYTFMKINNFSICIFDKKEMFKVKKPCPIQIREEIPLCWKSTKAK